MKRALLMSGVLLALTASIASAAGGVNLAWNDCYGAGGVVNRIFACDTNTGDNVLYLSYDPGVVIPDVNGSNPTIDLQSSSAVLPAWWQFKNSGSCRQFVLSATGLSAPTGTCPDTWGGHGVYGIAAYWVTSILPSLQPNHARILGSVSVTGAQAALVSPGTEYFVMWIRISNARTAGLGSCSGCLIPVCLVLNDVLLTTNNSGDFHLGTPLANNYATWQGGVVAPPGCPLAVPTINKTWGQVKSIYR